MASCWSWSWRSRTVLLVLVVLVGMVLATAGPARAAAAYWVAQGSGCSDGGPGTQTQPFCTIAKAAKVAGPDATVTVSAGTYREKATVVLGGAPGQPVTFQAQGEVVVLGTIDASARPWTPASGGAYSTPWSEAVAPKQVFVDGVLLAPATAPDAMGPGTWYHDAAGLVLYVHTADGSSPAGHQVEVGRQTQGFQATSRSDVVIDGFTFDGQNGSAVDLRDGARLSVRGVTVRNSGSYGILLSDTTASSVTGSEVLDAASHGVLVRGGSQATVAGNRTHDNRFHGIALQGLAASVVEANQSWANARPDVRSATGISVDHDAATGQRSANLVLRRNVVHDNQDSGISTLGDTQGCRYEDNLSYANGDHGFDVLNSPNNTFYANTSVGNHKDGLSVEGSSTGTRIFGNVAVDNGTTTSEYDLYVDASSGESVVSDSNLFFNTDPAVPPVKWNGVVYPTVAAYASASGQDTHARSADPLFADRAAGDFHLLAGSPAIDSGTSAPGDYPATDLEGGSRVNDDSAPNTGQGPTAWYDMGAFERQGHEVVVPAAPTGVTATAGDESATVSWTAPPAPPGAPILSYTVRAGAGGPTVTAPGSATSATVGGLTNGSSYTFTVSATNEVGEGSESDPTGPVTPTDTSAPGPVSGFSATASEGQVALSWANPGDTDLAGVVVQMAQGATPPASPAEGTRVYQDNGTAATVTGLSAGTTYSFAAFAHDEVPNYSAAATATATTPVPTSLQATASPSVVTYGQAASVSGTLTEGAGAAPVAGATVTLRARPAGGSAWSPVGTGTTSASGAVTIGHNPTENVEYQLAYAGGPGLLASTSATVPVGVRPLLTASLSPKQIKLGKTATIAGTVTPAHAGQQVQLQQLVGGAWQVAQQAVLSATGTYSFRVQGTATGVFTYRVAKPADADHVATESAPLQLTVR